MNDSMNDSKTTKKKKKGTIIVVGASGYIGKAVVRECVRQNYHTYAFVRQQRSQDAKEEDAITVVPCDVTNATQVLEQMQWVQQQQSNHVDDSNDNGITAVVSCLASRSGTQTDAYLIDYQATLHCLQAATQVSAQHFILLSAFCVQKPLLQFQQGTYVT